MQPLGGLQNEGVGYEGASHTEADTVEELAEINVDMAGLRIEEADEASKGGSSCISGNSRDDREVEEANEVKTDIDVSRHRKFSGSSVRDISSIADTGRKKICT